MKKILFGMLIVGLAAQSCTKVNENVYDKLAATEFDATPAGAQDELASIYGQITGTWSSNYAGRDNCWYDLNEFSSDEQYVPHRSDGNWGLDDAQLYLRTEPTSLAALSNTWNWNYGAVYDENAAIAALTAAKAPAADIAEAHVARDWNYWLLIDDFGDVPYYTTNDAASLKAGQTKRAVIYANIVADLKANVDLLSTTKGGAYYGRFNKWAGYMVLAKIYLNAAVYTASTPGASDGTPQWQAALDACNTIASGGFTLHPATANTTSLLGNTYFDLFGDVCPNDETILALSLTENVISGNIYTIRSLNTANGTAVLGYAGWDGTVIPEDFYNTYDPSDIRAKQFLVGPQALGGNTYTPTVLESIIDPGAGINEGIRDVKFYPVAPIDASGSSNDFPIYRYADVLLMQAECELRLGNAAAAAPYLNQVRERVGLADIAAPTLTDVYNERGRELNMEGHRRQDMIRFGTYLQAHGVAPNTVPAMSNTYLLFPIPTSVLSASPQLSQNPGYPKS